MTKRQSSLDQQYSRDEQYRPERCIQTCVGTWFATMSSRMQPDSTAKSEPGYQDSSCKAVSGDGSYGNLHEKWGHDAESVSIGQSSTQYGPGTVFSRVREGYSREISPLIAEYGFSTVHSIHFQLGRLGHGENQGETRTRTFKLHSGAGQG